MGNLGRGGQLQGISYTFYLAAVSHWKRETAYIRVARNWLLKVLKCISSCVRACVRADDADENDKF